MIKYKKLIFFLGLILLPCLRVRGEDWLSEQVRIEIQEEKKMKESFRNVPPRPLPRCPYGMLRHVIFIFVDHWEPGYGSAALNISNMWYNDYERMACQHVDADGCHPKHDWFCLYLDKKPLQTIAKTVFDGFGEMDIHIHHGTVNDDDKDNCPEMSGLIDQYLAYLNKVGACLTAEEQPQKTFGFIHGMWALDNSRVIDGHRQYCGCNEELNLLMSKNCYADFTFPAWGTMQPTIFQSKIFATRDCSHPTSYNIQLNVRELTVGYPLEAGELVIFQGPNCDTDIDQNDAPTPYRMDTWVNYNVSIPGKSNWVFVKVYTHGAQTLSYPSGVCNLVGDAIDKFYSDIERRYNDGKNYKLHYCTAREGYNIAMAAVDGVEDEDPNHFRDYKIPPPVNAFYYCDAFYNLLSRDAIHNTTEIQILENPLPSSLTIWTKDFRENVLVCEKNSAEESYSHSDASTSSTLSIPLIVKDDTPSRYYLLKQIRTITKSEDWDRYYR